MLQYVICKVNNKTPEQLLALISVIIDNFEHNSRLALVFLLLTLNM